MNQKWITPIILGLVLLTSDAYAAKTKPASQPTLVNPCSAAKQKLLYTSMVPVTAKLKVFIEKYRSKWNEFCSLSDQTKKPSIHELLSGAKIIERAFIKIFPRVHKQGILLKQKGKDTDKHYETAHHIVSKVYPGFIPGMEGSLKDFEYFRADMNLFSEYSKQGSPNDRKFFSVYSELNRGGVYPWFQKKKSSFSSCIKFGQFDWVAALKKISASRSELKGSFYQSSLNQVEEDLFRSILKEQNLCSCENTNAVGSDLTSLANYIKSDSTEERLKRLLPAIQRTTQLIQSRKIEVLSYKKGECRGI